MFHQLSQVPSESELDPLPIPPYLTTESYRLLLADHYQLVDQCANLTVAVVALWEQIRQLRQLLDMPVPPMPLAMTAAAAARPSIATISAEES